MAGKKKSLRSRLPALIGGAFMLLFTVGVVGLVRDFINNADAPEKVKVQKISLVKPPPPKPEEKPPEPEKVEQEQPKEEVQLDTPQPQDQPQDEGPPPGEQLGLDAEGGAGGDGFGLAARKGGRDITTLGGGGDRDAWYGRVISLYLEENLRRVKRLQGSSYNIVAQVWFDEAGGVLRVRLTQGSGNPETDHLLREEMSSLPPLRDPLPADLPQPVRVRVSSRA